MVILDGYVSVCTRAYLINIFMPVKMACPNQPTTTRWALNYPTYSYQDWG
jgi:hypothetical protein